ncbi:MAG: glycosyltransferase family 2 protein [Actinomycetota bacterium]
MKSPQVTVSIPTRNRAHLLRDCLRSVLEQSLADIEVFVSDNASTDDTAHVVASFRDPRVHYAPLEKNIGLQGNVTRSMELGTAPLVALLADDEVFLPDALARKVALLEQDPEVDMVHSALRLIHRGPNNEPLGETVSYGGGSVDAVEPGALVVRRILTEGYFIHATTVLARRSVVKNNPWEQADGPGCDIGFCLRASHRSRAIAYIAEPLGASLVHPLAASIEQLYEFESGAWHPTFKAMATVKHVHMRFLNKFGRELDDLPAIRRARRSQARKALVSMMKRKSRPQRSPRATWSLFWQAVPIEPRLLFEPHAMRLLIRSLAGERGRRLRRRILGRMPRWAGGAGREESRP